MSPSYGYSYLTSYGWTGTGTGLRKGAIERPLAIPPKKNLSGLGKDRDEAFPFWDQCVLYTRARVQAFHDHRSLFAAASKAITIKVSSDDEDADDTVCTPPPCPSFVRSANAVPQDPTSRIDPASVPLRRTTTGILSNQRPISGTPASPSGNTTPSLPVDTDPNGGLSADAGGRPSLLATAKREAAKRGLYARFFRGPVLGPDRPDLRAGNAPVSTSSPSPSPSSVRTSSTSTPVPEHVGETEQSKKRKSEDRVETKEERRERKRLKRERKAARAARKDEKALAGDKVKEKKDRLDRKAQKHRDRQTHGTSASSKKKARKSEAESAGDDIEQAGYTGRLEEKPASTSVGQQDTRSRRPPSNVNATDVSNIVLTTKKKNGKRKDTPY